ncbi:MAG: P-type Ca2+ transporter type [Chloroflexota bacterium]|nr:P-type Ca2+ transporter type [Chloroflexota bacterium]
MSAGGEITLVGAPAWHTMSAEDVLREQGVDAEQGLAAAEVTARRTKFGANRFAEQQPEPRLRAFLRQNADPMQIVLLVAGILSIWPVGQVSTGVLLILLTLLNAYLGLNQEGKAAAAVAALQKMMVVKARVRRDGELVELPAEELVPGDVVAFEAGDLVTADGRIIAAANLEIDEAALTGESLPVAKDLAPVAADAPLGDRHGMAYMNTNVTRGSGRFVVTATGMDTEVGHISGMLQVDKGQETPLTRQINALTRQLLVIAGLALTASIAIGKIRYDQSFDVLFVTAIAFAVSAIPTGLPAVITTILSYGTQQLAKAGAIVKQLRSVETLGSTSAINSDKTGTLTLNQMTAVELAIPGRRYTVSGTGYGTEGGIKRVAGDTDVPLDAFLLPCVLAADAVVKDGDLIGDPTEGALVVLAEKGGVSAVATRETYPRLATLPFDADYKMMATFHAMQDEAGRAVVRCFVKGAPDQLLARGTSVVTPDLSGVRPVDDDMRAAFVAENERLGAKGLRVMATGRKDFDPATFDPGADLLGLLDGLTLLALVGIVDPPRPAAKKSIAEAHGAGIQVRMITGDHAVTAEAIARELGIRGRAITGAEFRAMSDEQAVEEIDGIGVIARVTPEDKVHLVDILRKKGHIIAMTGDGVNDAPALKKADIGVAMGITGTEVSKEAAVMILTDDDFSTIVKAVHLGRGLYDNLKKYIRFQVGLLLGYIVTFLGSSLLNVLSGVPFVPVQTLFMNFTVQVFQAVGLGYGKPAEGLMERKPRPSSEPLLGRKLLVWLVVAAFVMGGGTLAVITWAANTYDETVARTMGMIAFSVSNVAFSFATKNEQRSVFSLDIMGDRPFLYATAASILTIVLMTEFGLFRRILDTTNLDLDQWVICIIVGLLIIPVSEIRKLIVKTPLDEVPSDVAPGAAAVAA